METKLIENDLSGLTSSMYSQIHYYYNLRNCSIINYMLIIYAHSDKLGHSGEILEQVKKNFVRHES